MDGTSATSLPERRALQRFPGDTLHPLRIRIDKGNNLVLASMQDFSVQGIGIIMNRAVMPGAVVEIELGSLVGRFHDVQTARVCHATLRSDGKWQVGCKLSSLLTVDDIEELG
jgi:hypothetical protein